MLLAALACAAGLWLKAPAGLIAAAAVCLSAGALALTWRLGRALQSARRALEERLEILAHLPAPAPPGAMPAPGDLEDAELARLLAECQAELEIRRSRPDPDPARRQARATAALKGARLSAARAAAASRAAEGRIPPAKIKRT